MRTPGTGQELTALSFIVDRMDLEPFRIDVPDTELNDLRRRLDQTRWPDELPDVGWSHGVPADRVRQLAVRWRDGFDWGAQEADLNRYPQFLTEIGGQRIHFVHARSPEPAETALVLIHGWPFADFRSMIGPLTDPAAHGSDPARAVDLIIPTLPGFGFSGPTQRPGDAATEHSAQLIKELMLRLGYRRYAVHGGDAGSFIAPELGRIDTEHITGVHLNGPITIPS